MKGNLKAARKAAKLTQKQAAERSGIALGTLRRWEQGKNEPDMASIILLANLYGVTTDTLLGSEYADEIPGAAKIIPFPSRTAVPLLGRIAAGQPIEMDEVDDRIEIPEPVFYKYPDAFLLTVDGESMNRILPNGCYALINPVDEIRRDNAPYAVCVNGYDATIKRVHRLNHGFELIPDSTDQTFVPKIYDYNDPATDVITVIGEVVWYTLPYDWSF